MSFKYLLIFAIAGIFVFGACVESQQDIGTEVIKKQQGSTGQGVAIEDIIANLDFYNGQEVVVSGKVMPGLAFEFISEQPYRIIQGDFLLWVITSDVSPVEGSFITVRGKIARPYQIKGRSYQLVLLEEDRQ